MGKGCAFASRGSGARVFITERDPICALQACMGCLQVAAIESVLAEFVIVVSSTGNFNIITLEHMKRLKNNAIFGHIGDFDNKIDIAGLEGLEGMKVDNIKPLVDRFVFPDGHGSDAPIFISEWDLICALQACVVGLQAEAPLAQFQRCHDDADNRREQLLSSS